MSYFAKPNFIIHDEWFDDDLKKTKPDVKNKKITTISNIHEFFYAQSNYKVGASENHLLSDIKTNEKEIITYNNENHNKKFTSLSYKKFRFFEKLTRVKSKLNSTKTPNYSLTIFGVAFIFGFLLFFIPQYQKNEPGVINKSVLIEKES